MTPAWYEGYSAYECGNNWNPYAHWEGFYPEYEVSCEEWQRGWEAAREDEGSYEQN